MTPQANQIIASLRAKFPDLIFEWIDSSWAFGDQSPCTLQVYKSVNPSNKKSITFQSGVATFAVEEYVEGFITHCIPLLEEPT